MESETNPTLIFQLICSKMRYILTFSLQLMSQDIIIQIMTKIIWNGTMECGIILWLVELLYQKI